MTALARPDPANIVASNVYIMDLLEKLLAEKYGELLNAEEAAAALGHAGSYFWGKRWRWPNFGRAGRKHSFADWVQWNERSEAERREEWDAMPVRERRKILGLKAEKE
jgi:hypothetical protein